MEKPEVFNRYDIRGDYPEELDEEFALRLGKSIGELVMRRAWEEKVCVGLDTRKSSKPLKDSLVSGLLSKGMDVVEVGKGPTDKVAFLGKELGCGASVMVTASHHGWSRNGFKLLYSEGNGFTNEDLEEVEDIFMGKLGRVRGVGERKVLENSRERYVEGLASSFKKYFDGLDSKIVVDCCNGGASKAAPEIFRKLGADVREVNCSGKPKREVDPEPKRGNRGQLKEVLEEENAGIAVGYDPDGDRVFAFDGNGKWLSGDEIFCILSEIVDPSKIVASVDTSKMLEEVTDAEIHYTRVGDIFVSDKGLEVGAELLGEPNGHYAVTGHSWYNSGLFSSLLLSAVADKIPEMKRGFPDYRSEKGVVELHSSGDKEEVMRSLVKEIEDKYKVLSTVDGIKFQEGGATCLVRPSGTSPKIRIKAESKEMGSARKIVEEVRELLH